MIQIKSKQDCCGCTACEHICPKGCITMQPDEEGFLYPRVAQERCISCGLCEKVCPVIHSNASGKPVAVYAAVNPDEDVRMHSSSGGIFSMLATKVIEAGGAVFGARFDKDWLVSHSKAETEEELGPFRGSKYLQSRIGDTFKEAKEILQNGRIVLFTGTSCQISGLKKYLRKDYPNLLTVDCVCHGVPSPGIWRAFLEETTPTGSRITDISFRNKTSGWKDYTVTVSYETGVKTEIRNIVFRDHPFMQAFLSNLTLRPSCYHCPAKEGASGSDITLGDFWGIDKIDKGMDDGKGTSLILINSAKGARWLDKIEFIRKSEPYEMALKYNPSIAASVPEPPYRTLFMKMFIRKGFHAAHRLLLSPALTKRLRRRLWLQLHK